MEDNNRKKIAVLGATGSIGRQTLDVISRAPERYQATVLTAGSKVEDLIDQCRKFKPRLAIIADDTKYEQLRNALAPLGIETASGAEALKSAAAADDVDTVVTATVGYSGLEPTIAAIRAGKDIALANKETLVVAGALINQLLKDSPSRIYPVDSEHSAIYQCLQGEKPEAVKRLLITASGGPFRTWSKEDIEKATVENALKHPNWHMGAKITIDSATMMNKAFELIEAHWLFDLPHAEVKPVVHPQSIVHSMVEFVDGAIKAQLGTPDMRLPIAYALGETRRDDLGLPHLSIADMAELTFMEPDYDKFPCLGLAKYAMERGGNTACVINAANEIAVAAFLGHKIRFTDIYATIMATLERAPFIALPDYDAYVATNTEARAIALDAIEKMKNESALKSRTSLKVLNIFNC